MAEFKKLYEALNENTKSAVFACGGSIPIKKEKTVDDFVPPVSIYWQTPNSSTASKIVLPDAGEGMNEPSVNNLIEACQPATFGKNGEDVLDESYRKALKLDADHFATSFEPYSSGIIDAVTQMLLPDIDSTPAAHSSIRAELYKLNVYAAPSGKFKSHVDTPRSVHQVGSLVVCLPVAHEGGQLVVRHGGREVTFDWGADKSAIQWGAFYSDCEHEVYEVTKGHRFTLTYNLYLEHLEPSSLLEAQHLPLYQPIRAVLDKPSFMPQGGLLGIECEHVYPQAVRSQLQALPSSLKGADMAIYKVLKAVGLPCTLRPILDDSDERRVECSQEKKPFDPEVVTIGRKPIGLKIVDASTEDYAWNEILDQWQPHTRAKITWLKRGGVDEPALVFMVYGNQTQIDYRYARLAILADIRPFPERRDDPQHA